MGAFRADTLIRKETETESNEEKRIIDIDEDEECRTKNLKLKIVYNKNELLKKSKKEIALIRKKIKEKKKNSEKFEKNMIMPRNIL